MVEGDAVACSELAPVGHETKPPARYTEASLVKELEERGIGRPSTYAAVIETIQARGYVWRKGTALVPAWTAFAVTNLLERHFGHLVDYSFTATMEEALDVIARGEGEAEKWLHSFYYGNGTPGLRELVDDEHLGADRPARREHDPDRHRRHRPRDHRARRSVRPVRAARRQRDRVAPARHRARRADRRDRARPHRQAVGGPDARSATIPRPACRSIALTGPLRAVRAARRAGTRHEEEAEAGVVVRVDDARDGHARRGAAAAEPAACRRQPMPKAREIVASPGRFGPYLKRADGETRSLTAEEQLFTITLAEAEALYAQPKQRRGRQAKPPIAELGENPDNGAAVRVLEGRYGPYVTDGNVNATVPRGHRSRRSSRSTRRSACCGRRPRRARRRRRRKKAAKKTTKKAAKKTAKKAAEEADEGDGEEAREEGAQKRRPRRRPTSARLTRTAPRLIGA